MQKVITLVCPECGAAFQRAHNRQTFCAPAHKVAFGNRQLARGQTVVGLAMAWRAGRHTKDPALKAAAKDAFGQLCRLLDAHNAEDRRAGRADPVRLYRARMAAGTLEQALYGRKPARPLPRGHLTPFGPPGPP